MNRFNGQNITTIDLANLLQDLLDQRKTIVTIGVESLTINDNFNNSSSTIRLNLKPGRSTVVGLR